MWRSMCSTLFRMGGGIPAVYKLAKIGRKMEILTELKHKNISEQVETAYPETSKIVNRTSSQLLTKNECTTIYATNTHSCTAHPSRIEARSQILTITWTAHKSATYQWLLNAKIQSSSLRNISHKRVRAAWPNVGY